MPKQKTKKSVKKVISSGRKVPWENLVKSHAEITRRAEAQFFSLPCKDLNQKRWTSLNDFSLSSFSGPWKVPISSIKSEQFIRAVRSGELPEIFIGGPCWAGSVQIGFKYVVAWQPLLYKEVSLTIDQNENLEINPAQGTWDVSPQVIRFMETQNILPLEPIDDIFANIIESSTNASGDLEKDLSSTFKDNIGSSFPELHKEITQPFPLNKAPEEPSDWILFTPPEQSGAFIRNLLLDYEKLENKLSENPKDIGGLELLEDNQGGKKDKIDVDVLPIVPLNESQHKAVKGMMGSEAVSVISGPPGCGKSQVVVSLLLNAWARGISVLFASNNNQAVDVVRERLEKFEDDMPISIRAGSKAHNNVVDTLRRTISIITDENTQTISQTVLLKKDTAIKEKARLNEFLDSKIPQRIDGELKSAIGAYGIYKNTVEEIKKLHEGLIVSLDETEFDVKPDQVSDLITEPLKEWINKITETKNIVKEEQNALKELNRKLQQITNKRNKELGSVGLEISESDDFDWLLNGPAPELLETWLNKYTDTLNKNIENAFKPFKWETGYDAWKSAEYAEKWVSDAIKLVSDTRSKCGELEKVVAEVKQKGTNLENVKIQIKESGIPENLKIELDFLSNWLGSFAEICTFDRNKFDWIPWSRRSKLIRSMKKNEKIFREKYPYKIWQNLGVINDESRAVLAPLVELSKEWIDVRTIWDEANVDRKKVRDTMSQLGGKIMRIHQQEFPDEFDLPSWLEIAIVLEQKIEQGEKAKIAWEKKVFFDKTRKELSDSLTELNSLASGIPIKEVWINGLGKDFVESLNALVIEPSPDRVTDARTKLYSKSLNKLILAWKKSRDYETEIIVFKDNIENIPSQESRVIEWWNTKPDIININQDSEKSLDKLGLPNSKHEVHEILLKMEKWNQDWDEYNQKIKPELSDKSSSEFKWAVESINKAFDTIPDKELKDDISSVFSDVISGDEVNWPVNEMIEKIKEFSPDRLIGMINSIDNQLERISFDIAKNERLNALSDDVDAQNALNKVLEVYNRNRGHMSEIGPDVYKDMLRAVPIWVTTAQSPQSILLEPKIFDLLVIDEATQCSLTNLLPLIYRAKRIAVIGDQEQLPAIPTISVEAEKALAQKYKVDDWLELFGHAQNDVYKTAVQCLPRRFTDVIGLNEHYRSHPLIIGFSNQHIYNKRLKLRKDPAHEKKIPIGNGIFGENVEGFCERGKFNRSWVNKPEADKVCELIASLRDQCTKGMFGHLTMGVVTPFRAQTEYIQEKLQTMGLLEKVKVGTAHTFQGDEKDIMIFSPVVSKGITENAARWVENPHNLINVSITRAKEALFFVGDMQACASQSGILGKFVNYVRTVQKLRDTSKEELDLFSWMVIEGFNPETHVVIKDVEVDFVLTHEGLRLVVEVDGKQHDQAKTQDKSRDVFLQQMGYKVLRVPARSVRETPASVIHDIRTQLEYN